MRDLRHVAARTALLLCAPATAAAQSPAMPTHPDWRSQAEIIAKMEGISVDEAVRRGHLQKFANEQHARFYEDEDYAGSWMTSNRDRFQVTYAFKGGQGGRTIANPELAKVAAYANVRFSQKELDAERIRLGPVLGANGISAAFGSNMQENRVHLYPSDHAKLVELIKSGQVTVADFVVIEKYPLPPPTPERG